MAENPDVVVEVRYEIGEGLGDDQLFGILECVSDELSARVATRRLLDRITPEQLDLFPVGLISRLVEEGKILNIGAAQEAAGGLSRQALHNATRSGQNKSGSNVNPLQHIKVGASKRKKTGVLLFLPSWLQAWHVRSKGSKTGRPRK